MTEFQGREHSPEQGKEIIEAKPYYSGYVRMLIEMYNASELPRVEGIVVEQRYGYLASIHYKDGERRTVFNNDLGINPGSSEALSADKGYSKFILRGLGIECPEGEEFLLPWWNEQLQASPRQRQNLNALTSDQADGYVTDSVGYPVYVKPVNGSQGKGIIKAFNREELESAFGQYNAELVKVALVERSLSMPDYRILVVDGEVVAAYERQPLQVRGDGGASIAELFERLEPIFKEQNRDINLEDQRKTALRVIGRLGLGLSYIPGHGELVRLSDVSNLSAGGMARDVTETMAERWRDVARTVAYGFNLRICGVDLACADIESAESEYSVIEVNSSPGTQHYAASSPEAERRMNDVFRGIFNNP